jgi:hypothetical protein
MLPAPMMPIFIASPWFRSISLGVLVAKRRGFDSVENEMKISSVLLVHAGWFTRRRVDLRLLLRPQKAE